MYKYLYKIVFIILLVSCSKIEQDSSQVNIQSYKVFLPFIERNKTKLIGVENEIANSPAENYYRGNFTKISVQWAYVEEVKGTYNWKKIDAKVLGDVKLISVKGSPGWANGNNIVCRPPLKEYWPDYVKLVNAVVERYNPTWIEIWNEPDTTKELDSGTAYYFGCWGDTFQDGEYYTQFVNYVIANIKNKDTIILAGALMNPTNSFTDGMFNKRINADGISFHVYEWCNKSYVLPYFIKRLQVLTDLPIYLSETSLLYITPSSQCEQDQIDFFLYAINRTDLELVVWYTLGCNMWRNSDMIECNPIRLKPIYYIYQDNISN